MEVKQFENIIIGAGLTGLLIARDLKEKSKDCLILEKSKGLGGRIATRRIDDVGLDHGAAFLSDLEELKKSSNLHLLSSPFGMYLEGSMNALPKALSKDLTILKEQKLQLISRSPRGWRLQTEEGMHFDCKNLILTAPVPQALELLAQNALAPDPQHPIFQVKYSKALILLVILKDLPNSLASTTFEDHPFLLMRERKLHPQGLVVQCSAEFSQKYFDSSEEAILKDIFAMIKRSPFQQSEIEKFELKKWRYSLAISNYSAPFLELHPQLYLCGDGFGNPSQSALALSATL
jgi:predicted NAD/FAD-dependent oxidoreductase